MGIVRLVTGWFLLAVVGCATQHRDHFTVPTPMPEGDTLIIGFQGGRDRWDDERVGVGRMAARLRELDLPRTHVQTVENTKRELAMRFVRTAVDRDGDGKLSQQERAATRIILYGQSFGGAAVVKFARQLQRLGLPVLLTVQVDSIGLRDDVLPANVRRAANLYQRDGRLIRGPQKIRAEDPSQTQILGNWRFGYRNSKINISDLPWHKTVLRRDHAKMDRDPRVWQKVEDLIVEAVRAN